MTVVLQEATEILTAASKGCGSYAKPILRHITAVADAVKKDGVQVSSWTHSLVNPTTQFDGLHCTPGVVFAFCYPCCAVYSTKQ